MSNLMYLFFAGLVAAAMNGLAGGGSFVSLPALIAAGVPPVAANASSTVALFPGGLATAWTFHDQFGSVCGVHVRWLLLVTLLGGLAGSLLLLWTPVAAFNLILPWLLLLATLALAFGRAIGMRLQGRLAARPAPVLAGQFVLGIYAGYFGGAAGLMMMAYWTVLGSHDLKALNGPRTMLVSAANAIAVLIFIWAGAVWWLQTIAVLLGGLAGGYAGAKIGRLMPPVWTRRLTLATTAGITLVFFLRAFLP